MRQIRKYSDSRLDSFCSYCGGSTETKDHVPSKVLLDKPYPENLPVVLACQKCNRDFSLDEEYFACLLECILAGSTEVDKIKRSSIRKTLIRKTKLRAQLEQAKRNMEGRTFFQIEKKRVLNVLLKLARGHAKYENSEPMLSEPSSIFFKPIHEFTEEEKDYFFHVDTDSMLFPEIGSRAFQRIEYSDQAGFMFNEWIDVQPENYSYAVYLDPGVKVRILIRNYLVAEIVWE